MHFIRNHRRAHARRGLLVIAAIHAVAAVALLASGAAKAEDCTTLNVQVRPLQVEYDYGHTLADLNRIAGQRHGNILGITHAKPSVVRAGCTVVVGFEPIKVLVAKELIVDACAWEHVLHHEQEHVTIWAAALRTLAADYALALTKGYADPYRTFHEAVGKALERHHHLDRPEEYATNGTACGGAIPRIILEALNAS